VRFITITSFFLVFLLISSTVFAQLQYYGVDVSLDEKGRAKVKLTLTFLMPEEKFSFSFIGRIEKFSASTAGFPVDCSLSVGGISNINCNLNLTKERRTLELNFETDDFVRVIEDKYYFDADFTLGKGINNLFVSVKLPEGFALVSEEKGRVSFSENATILSDGRHHIITWRFVDLKEGQNLRFYVLYERIQGLGPTNLIFSIWVFVIVALFISTFLYFRFLRKPEKIILSVLDEFERKVFDVIKEAGEINQKKVAQLTNLSKAKVSRVVKSLAERGLIEVERLGRTNKLKIVKKKLKFF
jgi:predicted transcriptional regulator